MESFPLFFRIRAITFTCIMLLSFLWLVLLCVEISTRWSISDQISQSLMLVFILTNTTTLITLPVLLLIQFRIWMDAARLFLLFVLQLGSATAGSIWSPRVRCPDQTLNDLSVCQLIVVYTMIVCWVIPAILIFYSTYFAVVVYLQSLIPVVVEPKPHSRLSGSDLESGSTGSPASWNENFKKTIRMQAPVPPRPLALPTVFHTRQSSLPQPSASLYQSTFPNDPHRQPAMPAFLYTGQQPLHAPSSVPDRHNSLPAFKHDNRPHLRLMPTLSMPRPLATDAPSSYLPTPSKNPPNGSFSFAPSTTSVQSPRDHIGISKHLSMMPSSASPQEMQNTEGSFSTRPWPTQTKLSKSPPIRLT